jgi:hypothetical protein
MTMQGIRKTVIATVALATIAAVPAKAQMTGWGPWGWTVYGTGEYDTDKVSLLLGGVSFAPKALGWVPLIGVQAHTLRFSPTGGSITQSGVQPYLGIQDNFGTGLAAIHVGYQFEGTKAVLAAPASIATGKGVVLTGQLESWGTGKELGGQALGTYNFGSKTFWGRGRVDMPIMQMNPGAIRLGAEAAFLNVSADPPTTTTSFSTTSVGPILMWQTGHGVNLGFAAGKRFGDSKATYFRIDVAIFPQK